MEKTECTKCHRDITTGREFGYRYANMNDICEECWIKAGNYPRGYMTLAGGWAP